MKDPKSPYYKNEEKTNFLSLAKGKTINNCSICGAKTLRMTVTVIVAPTSRYHSLFKSEYFPLNINGIDSLYKIFANKIQNDNDKY